LSPSSTYGFKVVVDVVDAVVVISSVEESVEELVVNVVVSVGSELVVDVDCIGVQRPFSQNPVKFVFSVSQVEPFSNETVAH
jgi:hypothetical protein